MLRKRNYVIIIALFAMMSAGCGGNPNPQTDPTRNLSAQGKAAYQAKKVVAALDALRDVAVSAEAQNPKLISTENTRKVVNYHTAALKILSATPEGWKATVTKGLDEVLGQLSEKERSQVEPFANLAKALLAEVK